MDSKSKYFSKCIFLRKILRGKVNLLGRIPLLILKYEILPNLCYTELLKYVLINFKQNKLQIYDFQTQKLECQNIKDINLSGFSKFIFQLSDSKFILSKNSLVFFSESQQDVKQYKLLHNYQKNKLTLDHQNKLLYVINSENQYVDSCCEIFDMKSYQSKSIQTCPYGARGNGVTFANESVYSIGGYAGYMSKDIYQYICIKDQWFKLKDLLQPESHVMQSLFIKELDSIIMFDEYQFFNGAALYDFKQVVNHGNNFPLSSCEYPNFQPILNKNRVFSYAISYETYDLCGYDIKKREWQKILCAKPSS